MSEITVILKDESRSYRQKFLAYSEFSVNIYDPEILRCICEAKKNFEGEPDSIQIKIHLEVQ
jgi:hypothetical protein